MNSHRIGQVKRAEDNMSGASARTIFILKSRVYILCDKFNFSDVSVTC